MQKLILVKKLQKQLLQFQHILMTHKDRQQKMLVVLQV